MEELPQENIIEFSDLEEVARLARARGEERPHDRRFTWGEPEDRPEIGTLQDKTREIARFVLIGWSTNAIADFLGFSKELIQQVRRSSLFRKYVDELQEKRDQSAIDFKADLERLIPEAIESYERVLSGTEGTPALRVKVAGEVLDRSGLGPVRQSVVQNFNARLTMQDIEEIRTRAEESRRRRNAILTNAEPVDSDS